MHTLTRKLDVKFLSSCQVEGARSVLVVVVDDVYRPRALIGNSKSGTKCTAHIKTEAEKCLAETHFSGRICCMEQWAL
jgi:hypothetical protein